MEIMGWLLVSVEPVEVVDLRALPILLVVDQVAVDLVEMELTVMPLQVDLPILTGEQLVRLLELQVLVLVVLVEVEVLTGLTGPVLVVVVDILVEAPGYITAAAAAVVPIIQVVLKRIQLVSKQEMVRCLFLGPVFLVRVQEFQYQ